jgi:TonB family protein
MPKEGHPPLKFVLEALAAPLSVRSDPAGGVVTVDGQRMGTTPLEALMVMPGPHVISVSRASYQAWKTSVAVTAGKPLELVAHLTPAKGKEAPPRAAAIAAATAPTAEPPVHPGDLVVLGPGVDSPRKVSGKTALYPAVAIQKKLEGKVTVELIVDENGSPRDLAVVESAGEALDNAVLDAIRTWRYEPAKKNGVPVKVRIREWQRFELRNDH